MLSQKSRIRFGYWSAIILLWISYAFIFYNGSQLNRRSGMISQSLLGINKVEAVIRLITEAETSVRGFIIMQADSSLRLYERNRRLLPGSIAELRNHYKEEADKENKIDSLRFYITKRIWQFEFSLQSFKEAGMNLTPAMLSLRPETNQIMNRVRSISDELIKEGNTELEIRTKEFASSYRSVMNITMITLVIAVFAIIFSLVNYVRENKARGLAEARSVAYEKDLEGNIQDLENINKELKELKSNEKFASTGRVARTIAHEVRNPLTNISLATEQLKDVESHNPESHLLLDMISRNTVRINQLVSDLLNATRFIQLEMTRVNITDILEDTLGMASDRLNLREVKLVRDYCTDECFVMVDSEKIKVAFLNIILNAVEAMEGEKGILTLTTRAENKKCKVIITDNGVGMDEETIQSLFEPFFTKKPKGNGLGMTNTQNIILNHKGSIYVHSELGKGTSFIIYLDLA